MKDTPAQARARRAREGKRARKEALEKENQELRARLSELEKRGPRPGAEFEGAAKAPPEPAAAREPPPPPVAPPDAIAPDARATMLVLTIAADALVPPLGAWALQRMRGASQDAAARAAEQLKLEEEERRKIVEAGAPLLREMELSPEYRFAVLCISIYAGKLMRAAALVAEAPPPRPKVIDIRPEPAPDAAAPAPA